MQQTCKACGLPDRFDFNVPDDLWHAVVPLPLRNRVVCLTCFDKFARERDVDYANAIHNLYFAGDQASFVFQVVSATGTTNNSPPRA
jgi:hypothetical protein